MKCLCRSMRIRRGLMRRIVCCRRMSRTNSRRIEIGLMMDSSKIYRSSRSNREGIHMAPLWVRLARTHRKRRIEIMQQVMRLQHPTHPNSNHSEIRSTLTKMAVLQIPKSSHSPTMIGKISSYLLMEAMPRDQYHRRKVPSRIISTRIKEEWYQMRSVKKMDPICIVLKKIRQ